MPETVIADKYLDQIPRFNLPKELTNPDVPRETSAETPPVAPPESKSDAKPVQAGTEPAPVQTEVKTPGTDQAKPATEVKPESTAAERRMFRAIRKAAEERARAEQLEREIAEIKAKQVPVVDTQVPKAENYTDVEEYAKAREAYATAKALRERDEKSRNEAVKAAQTALVSKWEEKVLEAQDKYEDFDEVVGVLKPTTPWAVAIMKTENGADIAHHLGTHPQEARKLIVLDPYDQILEISKLSHKLSAVPDKPKEPSKAPPPITPVTGEAVVSDELQPQMPFEKYRKIGNKMFRGNR